MLAPAVVPEFRVSRNRRRIAPVEYRDAVETWARSRGGHADIVWVGPPANVWQVRLSLRVGDPRHQTGESFEAVHLHDWWTADEWLKRKPDLARKRALTRQARPGKRAYRVMGGYYAYELDELGIEGIIARLDRGNLLSGRGEFKSAEQAAETQRQRWRDLKHKRRRDEREDARHRSLDLRRHLLKIPFLPVGIELTRTATTTATSTQEPG